MPQSAVDAVDFEVDLLVFGLLLLEMSQNRTEVRERFVSHALSEELEVDFRYFLRLRDLGFAHQFRLLHLSPQLPVHADVFVRFYFLDQRE